MSPAKATLFIALAFVVGAIFPLLGLLAAVWCAAAYYYAGRGASTTCDAKLLEEIRELERLEHQRAKRRR